MANGDELLKTIKARLNDKENPLDVNTAVQFMLSLQLDAIEKEKEKEKERKEKEKEQDGFNDKVMKMWPAHKVTNWVGGAIILGIIGLFFDFISIKIGLP